MTVAETDNSTVNLVRDTMQLLADIGRIRRWSARGVYTDPEALLGLPAPIEVDQALHKDASEKAD